VNDRNPEFEQLLDFIRDNRAFDFTGYKRPSLMRRISKRMQERSVDSFAAYRELLEREPEEFVPLFDTILINVTSFFRDEIAWDYLRSDVIPTIAAHDHDIRVVDRLRDRPGGVLRRDPARRSARRRRLPPAREGLRHRHRPRRAQRRAARAVHGEAGRVGAA
jgi:hypothetical protein